MAVLFITGISTKNLQQKADLNKKVEYHKIKKLYFQI